MRRLILAFAILTAALASAGLESTQTPALAAVDPSSTLIGCERAADNIAITATSHLDPTCTYTGRFRVESSGVTLDCQGATIASNPGAGGVGILIHAPVAAAQSDVTVRNCRVEGYLNSIKVTRDGFRNLAAGAEYDNGTSNIVIEDVHVSGSRGVGIYVDGYVEGVSILRSTVQGAGSSGIYLEGGSRRNLVEGNLIIDNGYRENGPGGQQFNFGGSTWWFWGVGREGISVDGSLENTIRANTFRGNSAGGIFLYKNCGEYPNSGRYFERRTPADRNVIEGNRFEGERIGVWVGSRMAENTLPMACTDPAYVDADFVRIVLDYAADNVVRDNDFVDVTYGVRVEDDRTTVADNRFSGQGPDRWAVIVGTADRTNALGRPVTGLVLTGNRSTIVDNPDPYRWVHGQTGTIDSDNEAVLGHTELCPGVPVPRQPFVFVIALALAPSDGSKPPTPDLTLDEVGPLPPCEGIDRTPTTTTTSSTTTSPETTTTVIEPTTTSTSTTAVGNPSTTVAIPTSTVVPDPSTTTSSTSTTAAPTTTSAQTTTAVPTTAAPASSVPPPSTVPTGAGTPTTARPPGPSARPYNGEVLPGSIGPAAPAAPRPARPTYSG